MNLGLVLNGAQRSGLSALLIFGVTSARPETSGPSLGKDRKLRVYSKARLYS